MWINKEQTTSPPNMALFSIAYDSANKLCVIFGGEAADYSWLNHTWIYNESTNTWKDMSPVQSPPATLLSSMVYDEKDGIMILFGGTYDTKNTVSGNTWTYNVSANIWKRMEPTVNPFSRQNPLMAYDRARGTTILFGGYNPLLNSCITYNDTWSYNFQNNSWNDLNPVNAPIYSPKSSMVYNEKTNRFILFGAGSDPAKSNETWEYDPDNNTWVQLDMPISPSPRSHHALGFDEINGKIMLFGGQSSEYGDNSSTLFDIWGLNQKINYSTSGTYLSQPFDTGGNAYFGDIQWNASMPPGTNVKFQLRTGAAQIDMDAKDFTGPDGTAGTFFFNNGQRIPSIYNGSRWIQYCAYLITDNILTTPSLTSVTIHYNIIHDILLISPVGDENWTGIQKISWVANDKDNDPLVFEIHLVNEYDNLILVNDLPNGRSQWSWNTDLIPNGTYRIRITARDDNPSIPLAVNATSNPFTIYHPIPPIPPNHLPHVKLISPANNSYLINRNVRLQWEGTDLDNDSLTYVIRYSDRPLIQGNVFALITAAELIDLNGLDNNKTYFWSVDATDKKASGTDTPTEVWSFTVKLPPANIPVRFTSTPSIIAWVGKEYTYNLTSIDEDGDIPIFSIVSAPATMTLDSSTGKLRWTPLTSDMGNHTITLRVTDGRDSTDNQTFTLTVKEIPIPPVFPPKCAITYPPNATRTNGTIRINGTAINGTLPLVTVRIRIDGGVWMDAFGLDVWIFSLNTHTLTNGKHRLEAQAIDANLSSETASVDFIVSNPEPGVSSGGNSWCLPTIIIASILGLGTLVFLWKKKRR